MTPVGTAVAINACCGSSLQARTRDFKFVKLQQQQGIDEKRAKTAVRRVKDGADDGHTRTHGTNTFEAVATGWLEPGDGGGGRPVTAARIILLAIT